MHCCTRCGRSVYSETYSGSSKFFGLLTLRCTGVFHFRPGGDDSAAREEGKYYFKISLKKGCGKQMDLLQFPHRLITKIPPPAVTLCFAHLAIFSGNAGPVLRCRQA